MTQFTSSNARVSMRRESRQMDSGKLIRQERLASLGDALLSMIFALLFSVSWSVLIMNQIGATFQLLPLILTQAFVMLLWWLAFRYPVPALVLTGGAAVVVGLSVLLKTLRPGSFLQPVYDFSYRAFEQLRDSALWSFAVTQGELTQPAYYVLVLSILAASVGFLIVWKKPLPFLLLAILLFPYFGAAPASAQEPINIIMLLIGLFVVAVVFSRYSRLNINRRHPFSVPPLITIAILLLASYALHTVLPQNFLKEPRLADTMRQQQKRWGAPETVNYFEFSLRDAGYYPMNQNLGGPLELMHDPFMNVSGPAQSIYLRGAISDEYTGHAWVGQIMDPNYIFDNVARHGKQAEVFGYPQSMRGGEEWLDKLFTGANIEIQPLQVPIQVIFNGGRPQMIDSGEVEEEQIYYFNDGGQIYSGKEIPHTGYEVEGYISRSLSVSEKHSILRSGIEQGAFSLTPIIVTPGYRDALMAHDPALFDLVYGERGNSPQDLLNQLFALQRHLSSNYTYETNVSYPDPNQDFLNWFLQEKTGYCTYFGTAMTLLAREMGLNARYVEGFIVPAVEDYEGMGRVERTVLGDSAHAWTEVYFDGLGWIPFDATPADALSAIRNEQNEQDPEPSQPQETNQPTNPPTTTAEETTTEMTRETTQPKDESPVTTPPPPPDKPESESEPQNENRPPLSPAQKLLLMIIGIILLILLLLALFLLNRHKLWKRRHSKERLMALCMGDQQTAVSAIWEDLKQLYKLKSGKGFAVNQTFLRRFATLDKEFFEHREETGNLAFRSMETLLYAEQPLTVEQWEPVLDYYEQVELSLKESIPRMKWRWNRWLFPGKSGHF